MRVRQPVEHPITIRGRAHSTALKLKAAMALEWKNEFSVQVPAVDLQRRQLVEMINALDKEMRMGKDKEVLARALAEVMQYARGHFVTEERLMAQNGYPDARKHTAEHEKLIAVLREFNAGFGTGSIALSIGAIGFLESWLVKHMLEADKAMGQYLSSARVAA